MNLPTPQHFDLQIENGVVTILLNRPERLNALTFESYDELARTFEALNESREVHSVVITGAGKGFCSGGDVTGIIAELFARDARGLLEFTRLTGRLIASIRMLRRPVIGAINGVAVGAGAVIAAACDLRIAAPEARFGFIFPQVGLSGADMGATYLLPRIVGLGRASELLFFGDIIGAEEAYRIGLVNRIAPSAAEAVEMARAWAKRLAAGPAFAHAMTKQMLESEHALKLADAIEAEAQAQAICMLHPDFRAAHEAWKAKHPPRFDARAPGSGAGP